MPGSILGEEILAELASRTKHSDPHVRRIARALLGNVKKGSNGWVKRALDSPKMNVYESSFEKALLLEKIMLHSLLHDFWETVIKLREVPEKELGEIKDRIIELGRLGWDGVVEQITDDIRARVVGKPIQTHRLERYESLIRNVVVPLLGKSRSEIIVVDAGCSSGAGSHAARMCELPLERWVAIDKCYPKEDLAWVLTCSVRLGEILDGRFERIAKRMLNWPPEFQFVKGNIENLPKNFLTKLADVYLAVFSYYQLKNPKRAFTQALKMVKTGGSIILTDYFLPGKFTPESVVTPGQGGRLATAVWQNKGMGEAELVSTFFWADTDLSRLI